MQAEQAELIRTPKVGETWVAEDGALCEVFSVWIGNKRENGVVVRWQKKLERRSYYSIAEFVALLVPLDKPLVDPNVQPDFFASAAPHESPG